MLIPAKNGQYGQIASDGRLRAGGRDGFLFRGGAAYRRRPAGDLEDDRPVRRSPAGAATGSLDPRPDAHRCRTPLLRARQDGDPGGRRGGTRSARRWGWIKRPAANIGGDHFREASGRTAITEIPGPAPGTGNRHRPRRPCHRSRFGRHRCRPSHGPTLGFVGGGEAAGARAPVRPGNARLSRTGRNPIRAGRPRGA